MYAHSEFKLGDIRFEDSQHQAPNLTSALKDRITVAIQTFMYRDQLKTFVPCSIKDLITVVSQRSNYRGQRSNYRSQRSNTSNRDQ